MSKYTDDFRRAGHQAVDWIAEYLEETRRYPVLPRIKPDHATETAASTPAGVIASLPCRGNRTETAPEPSPRRSA